MSTGQSLHIEKVVVFYRHHIYHTRNPMLEHQKGACFSSCLHCFSTFRVTVYAKLMGGRQEQQWGTPGSWEGA